MKKSTADVTDALYRTFDLRTILDKFELLGDPNMLTQKRFFGWCSTGVLGR